MQVPKASGRDGNRAAVLAATGFVVVAGFQLLLALGVPLGKAAWGGGQATVPPDLRVASSVSMAVFIGAALIVLGRAGFWGLRLAGIFRVGTWLPAVAMGFGAVLNLASSSVWERFIWAPVALILAVLSAMVARGRSDERVSVGVDH
jgi:predicted anti-sigma-YlaC factor YlaD